MAQKTVVTLIDDIDGKVADETIGFALDGVQYEIDLRESNAATLRLVLEPYRVAARRAGAAVSGGNGDGGRPAGGDPERSARIRAWAREHGLTVSERGRIAANLVQAYEAGDPTAATSYGFAGLIPAGPV